MAPVAGSKEAAAAVPSPFLERGCISAAFETDRSSRSEGSSWSPGSSGNRPAESRAADAPGRAEGTLTADAGGGRVDWGCPVAPRTADSGMIRDSGHTVAQENQYDANEATGSSCVPFRGPSTARPARFHVDPV